MADPSFQIPKRRKTAYKITQKRNVTKKYLTKKEQKSLRAALFQPVQSSGSTWGESEHHNSTSTLS
jgi:hypothetical protein